MMTRKVLLVMWKPASVSNSSRLRFSERVNGPGAPGGGRWGRLRRMGRGRGRRPHSVACIA